MVGWERHSWVHQNAWVKNLLQMLNGKVQGLGTQILELHWWLNTYGLPTISV
jgi:hypothetical protein